jgi:hypothetical protein
MVTVFSKTAKVKVHGKLQNAKAIHLIPLTHFYYLQDGIA